MFFGNKNDIANLLPYVSASLRKALEYVAATDFSKVENGEYEIEGRDIYAGVNTYMTEPKAERRAEKHQKYIDVQYVGRGVEEIFYTSLTDAFVETENKLATNDVVFYEDPHEVNSVVLHEGDFAIFFPWELHRPNCTAEEACEVQKIVVKVKA